MWSSNFIGDLQANKAWSGRPENLRPCAPAPGRRQIKLTQSSAAFRRNSLYFLFFFLFPRWDLGSRLLQGSRCCPRPALCSPRCRDAEVPAEGSIPPALRVPAPGRGPMQAKPRPQRGLGLPWKNPGRWEREQTPLCGESPCHPRGAAAKLS